MRAKYLGSTLGATLLWDNHAAPSKSMVAEVTSQYCSGIMPGDIRGAYLADTTAETITASGELVTNGDFALGTGWTLGTGWSISSGVANHSAGTAADMSQAFTTVIGKSYSVTLTISGGSLGVAYLGNTAFYPSAGTNTYTVVSANTTFGLILSAGVGAVTVDNISVKLADPDRSVKNKGLVLSGSLVKTAVASGAGLVSYSGFSASNYLEAPYDSGLDFGTGDFCVMGWVNLSSTGSQQLFSRLTAGAGAIGLFILTGTWNYHCSATATFVSTGIAAVAGLNHVALFRASGTLYFYVNGALVYSVANTANVTNTSALATLGIYYDHSSPVLGSMALWRISATAPSLDQLQHIYRTELPLFQANAQCTIAGTGTAVTALAYDDVADTLHVGTSWGRSAFRDLLRVDSEATTTGAVTSLSANQGAVLTGGASSGRFYQPAMLLRDELRRKDEARKALGKVPVFFDFTATASQTAFVLPKGYTAKALYKNGTLMRETTTGTYWTRSNDGFQETATLSVGATVSDWVSVMATRNY